MIGLILGGVALAVLSAFAYSALYVPPSCSDGVLNQDESGIDCGGSCAYVCTVDALSPTTLFATLLTTPDERTDLVAAIENRNGDLGAKSVPFKISLYTASGTLRKELQGSLDLPPRTVVPLFIPGVELSGGEATRAFVEIAPTAPRWYRLDRDPRIVPLVEVRPLDTTRALPRVVAELTNPSISPLVRVPVVALVRDTSTGNVVAASQTVVPLIAPQGSAEALFTWNEPFKAASVRVEVLPVVPLP